MAGPWFAVPRSGDDWLTVDTIWISNGDRSNQARVEIRLELEEARDEI